MIPAICRRPGTTSTRCLLHRGFFEVDEELAAEGTGLFPDTYLYIGAWGKGLAFVNGFNLGYYWPVRGPANTMCAPLSPRPSCLQQWRSHSCPPPAPVLTSMLVPARS